MIIFALWAVELPGQSYLEREDQWVRATMAGMTLDQKIGQLFMVRAYSKGNRAEENIISEYISKYHIGGVCFFQGSPVNQTQLINRYQREARIPLFMGIDGEWGLGMRFPNEAISFPRQLMLGAIKDNRLIYEMGREVAKQCKKVGINMNFAPSIDINNNPSNPVIYDRSFGELPQNVTAKGYMYMKAMEDEGILSCVKHFPGHGDTDVDSHENLPVLSHSMARLEQTEFYPFRRLASQGVSAMMIGHLSVPALDARPNRPTTLSHKVIKDILRDDMGFNGLLVTDAMDMKGVTKYFPNGIAEAEAFLAGNDIILLPENLPKAIRSIKDYLVDGKITMDRIDESVERILRAKYKAGLNTIPGHTTENINKYINRDKAEGIKQKLTEAAITLLNDRSNIIPLRDVPGSNIASLSINTIRSTPFQERVTSYTSARDYQLMPNQLPSQATFMMQTLSQFDYVVVGIHTSGKRSDFSREVPQSLVSFLTELQNKTKVVVALFGSPYLASSLEFADHLLLCYDNDPLTQDVAAQLIFGAGDISGTLPVSVNGKWKVGYGLARNNLGRLGYSKPEMVGMSGDTLRKIDSIMAEMISLRAAPGGQVLIAKDGKIVLQKAYGKLTQDGYYVNNNTIYDIASITKIMSTTLAVMKLTDRNLVNVNNPLRNYIAGIDTTDKADIPVKDIMAHHGRLISWIPFYEYTLPKVKSQALNPNYYSPLLNENFNIPVAKSMFMRNDYRDTIYRMIWQSTLREKNNYRYSDLGFLIMQKIVENQSGQPLDRFVYDNFYRQLGLKNTGYKISLTHPVQYVAPTEIDNYFRHQTLQGYVHDMGAAMMGGVAGHAGLFSTAGDMAVIMQMLLNKGTYGGVRYIRPETVSLFTTRHERSSRRGLGFDMKEMDSGRTKNVSDLAPESIFGHTGFTGTAAWADPANKIVYIFCANRTYPGRHNQTFNNREYRIKVQNLIYKALEGYKNFEYL